MTHSFAVFRRPELAGHIRAFGEWAGDRIAVADVDALVDFKNKAPAASISHPTDDHFVPLLLALGAATDLSVPAQTAFSRFVYGNSIRSIQVA